MSSTTVEKIKERLDIADVVGAYVKLEKAGSGLKGNCPFHNEKTPSFFVSPSRGSYYCFGCGAKGDVFTFVQEFEGLDFAGALKHLAEKAGVQIEHVSLQKKQEEHELREVIDIASVWFVSNLKEKKEAIAYLEKRGVKNETIKDWSIGYAPLEWRALHDYLKEKGHSDKKLVRAGLIKENEKGNYYDVFRGRIMFPISDSQGKIIAWSGRIFDEDPEAPKYLNSPETELFKKSEVLFGFDRAKHSIKKKGYSILVEGQLDLILCHQHGYTNAVATSGTALTEMHLQKLKRLSPKIMMVFDGDKAGVQAAKRSAELALKLGFEVKIAPLKDGKDPADILSTNPDELAQVLKSATHIIDFTLSLVLSRGGDRVSLGKAIRDEVLPLVSQLKSSIEESHYVALIAKRTGIKEEAIWTDLRQSVKIDAPSYIEESLKKETQKTNAYIARRLLGIIVWQRGLSDPYIQPEDLEKKMISIMGQEQYEKLVASHQDSHNELVFEAESYYGSKEALQSDIEELLLNVHEDIVNSEIISLHTQLLDAERNKDASSAEEAMKRLSELIRKKNQLSEERRKLLEK